MVVVLSQLELIGLYSVIAVAVGALVYALILRKQVLRESTGSGKVKEVWLGIKAGANAYLKTQFKSLIYFVGILGVFLFLSASLDPAITNIPNSITIIIGRVGAFLIGAFFSAMIGYVGMNMAVQGNIRVSEASRRGFRDALRIAYKTGTITGMLTDGLGLLGGTIIFLIYVDHSPDVLLGFGFGGTLLALFMRVGGGIYTKAADIGADLVGKVEVGIPEDDPRNAAVVADLVGDNVGDCAGMAADIFESYEVTMVSALILGLAIATRPGARNGFEAEWIVFPLLARGIGIISTIIGTYAVSKWPDRLTKGDAFKAMDLSYDLSSLLSAASFLLLAVFYVGDIRVFLVTTMGIVLAISFNKLAEHFTSANKGPVDKVAASSKTGSATLILQGLALGFESTVWTTLLIALTIVVSILIWSGTGSILFAFYGVALASIGMLTQTGNNVAMDTFGPIVDNANGIGEMAGLEGEPRKILADLDASGNTTKAVTKSLAIASAVLAAVSLFSAFTETLHINLDIASDPLVFVGILVGGSLPFLFSFISIRAVSRAAGKIIEEVRKQFKMPGIIEGLRLPDYAKVVSICTSAAQRELASLAIIAILTPLAVGVLLGATAWGGFLAGVIVTGQLLAVFMANSGGAWDNAKKKIEDGFYGGKYSESHKAAVVGDTVGDPLKDTAGPALNPMIKVMNLISLLFSGAILSLRNTLTVSVLGVDVPIVAVIMSISLVAIIGGMIFYSKRETEAEEKVLDTEAPISRDITVTPNPVRVNTDIALNATMDDRETGGSKIASAEYSLDGSFWCPMTSTEGAMNSPVAKIHAETSVAKPGIYNLRVRGSDEVGNVATEKSIDLAVYDPEAGSVSGEGWINSSPGAYSPNPALTGKATFKFTAKYEKDAVVPSGQTDFVFAAADLTFKSTSYDWLVIYGSEAVLKGSGTINGKGDYRFGLIGVDGKVKGEAHMDRFRLRIWEKANGKLVYDSGLSGPENVPPTTAIPSGSVDIHKEQKPKRTKQNPTKS